MLENESEEGDDGNCDAEETVQAQSMDFVITRSRSKQPQASGRNTGNEAEPDNEKNDAPDLFARAKEPIYFENEGGG